MTYYVITTYTIEELPEQRILRDEALDRALNKQIAWVANKKIVDGKLIVSRRTNSKEYADSWAKFINDFWAASPNSSYLESCIVVEVEETPDITATSV